jgi:hypothetical protein
MACGYTTLNTQCLYQATSATELGYQCAGEGTVNEVVVLDFDKKEFRYLEDLAESVQEESLGQYRPGAHPAPYFVCEQYCSNDVNCLGFVPDFEYGQDDHHNSKYSFHEEDEEDVEFEEIRCVIARESSPSNVSATVANQDIALDLMAPCYVKNSDMCMSPVVLGKSSGGDANITITTDDMCSACSSMTSTTGDEQCFWCEPGGFFTLSGYSNEDPRLVGKCVCTSDLMLGSNAALNAASKEHVCDNILEWSEARPVSATVLAITNNDGNTTSTITEFSCAASLETLRMTDELMAGKARKLAPLFIFVACVIILGLCAVVRILAAAKQATNGSERALPNTDDGDDTVATAEEYESGGVVMANPSTMGKEVQTGVPAMV